MSNPSKWLGFAIGAIEVGIGIATGNVALIVSGSAMIVSQAVVDLTSKSQARLASEAQLQLGEQPRSALVGETYTGGTLVDAFDWGGKYKTSRETLVIRLTDHKCHSLTGFYVNDTWVPYSGNGNYEKFNADGKEHLHVYFRSDTTTQALPSTVTDHGKGWTVNDVGESGCDVVVEYYADKPDAKHPVWPNGRPTFGWVVKGLLCYDPRKDDTVPGGSGSHRWDDPSTREWTENAAIVRYNWVRGIFANDDVSDQTKLLIGRGLSAEEAPPENIFAAANLCDEIAGESKVGEWTETTLNFPDRGLSPDGTMLYAVGGTGFESFYLKTRTEFAAQSTLINGASVGSAIAVTNDGIYTLIGGGSGINFINKYGTETLLLGTTETIYGNGLGYAGGDIWLYPNIALADPMLVGHYDDGEYTEPTINYTTTQAFTNSAGDAIGVGYVDGDNTLAIGPAGEFGTLIDTSAYGTTGAAYGFDNGDNYVIAQDDHLFLVDKVSPTIVAASNIGSLPLHAIDMFSATPIGSETFWIDTRQFASADLSLLRDIDLADWTVPDVGGVESGQPFYDRINNALVSFTNASPGVIERFLDRNGSYRVSGPIYANQTFLEVEEMFAAATAGNIITHQGSVELEPGQAKSIVASFTDDDLVVGSNTTWNDGVLSESDPEWVNTVVGEYVEPDQKWSNHSTPPARDVDTIVPDGGPKEATATLRLVRYREQAQRIVEILRRQGRIWGRATVTLGPRFCRIEEGDWIEWTSARRFGGATKTFRVDAYKVDEKWQITLTLREISAEVYADDAVFSIDRSRPQSTPPPPEIGAPDADNWTLSATTLDSEGASIPALLLEGSAADDDQASAIVVEYWKSDGVLDPESSPDDVDWSTDGTYPPDMTTDTISGLVGGATYYVAVSYIVNDTPGDRLVLGPVTLSDYNTNPILTEEDSVTPLHLEDDTALINLG